MKLQIKFRKKVLGQNHSDKTVFQFSHNRQVLSCFELMQNLKKLLSLHSCHQSPLTTDEILSDPDLLIYRRVHHQFNCDGQLVWYKGTVLGYDRDSREFRIAYDNDDEQYSFPLLEDLTNNELVILN